MLNFNPYMEVKYFLHSRNLFKQPGMKILAIIPSSRKSIMHTLLTSGISEDIIWIVIHILIY